MEDIKEKKTFKLEALARFLFAQSGRIYDPKDVFEVDKEEYRDYLIGNKLCKLAPKDAEITETDQDKRDKIAIEAAELEAQTKEDVSKVIEEKFAEKPTAPVKKAKKAKK